MNKISSLRWLGFFLLSTILTGLTLRWQLAGHQWDWTSHLDWRRAHSHLGFYGVLFPLTWLIFQTVGIWSPPIKIWTTYGVLVALAGISFLFQGYGFFSILASTGILVVWLVFAWKNRSSLKWETKNRLASVPLSILLAALIIPLVAVFAHRNPLLANEMARTFLTFLLFGVFTPTVLQMLGLPNANPVLWFLSTIVSALFLTGLVPNPILGLGLIWMAFEILRAFYRRQALGKLSRWKDSRLTLAWCFFALALILTGTGIVPYSYYQAIAGIHFLVLGPLLMSFGLVHLKLRPAAWLRGAYELSLLTMVSSISLQSWVSTSLSLLSAISGTFLVMSLIGVLITCRVPIDNPV